MNGEEEKKYWVGRDLGPPKSYPKMEKSLNGKIGPINGQKCPCSVPFISFFSLVFYLFIFFIIFCLTRHDFFLRHTNFYFLINWIFLSLFCFNYYFLTLSRFIRKFIQTYFLFLFFFLSLHFFSLNQTTKMRKIKVFLSFHFSNSLIKWTPRVIEFTMVDLSCTKY